MRLFIDSSINEFEEKIQSFIPSEEHSLPPSLLRLQLTTDEEGKNVVLHPSPAELVARTDAWPRPGRLGGTPCERLKIILVP